MKPLVLLLAAAAALPVAAQPVDTTSFRIGFEAEASFDSRIFGQFLERPSWGGAYQETGPENAYVEATGRLMPQAVEAMKATHIPVIRWPGGTDVDYMDWTDMIDNAPGREGAGRPLSVGHTGEEITNRFGMDEALNLIEELGAEPILVVNLRDAVAQVKSIEEVAMHAAGLVAYATAPVGTDLPDGMPDWPAIRAQNGRTEPWDVPYVQIGNEWFLFTDENGERYLGFGDVKPEVEARTFAALRAIADAVHAVHPDAEIIIDGMTGDIREDTRRELGDRVDYLALHQYHPWAMSTVSLDGQPLDAREFATDRSKRGAIWRAWSTPRFLAADGTGKLPDGWADQVVAQGYPIAMTEWNWNGWWDVGDSGGVYDPYGARAMGSLTMLHEIMRRSGDVHIATQSMLIGEFWEIAGIRYYPDIDLAFRRPALVGMGFYTDFHGDRRVAVEHDGLPRYDQPYQIGAFRPKTGVAYLDPVATRTDDTLYVHVLNRRYEDADSSLVRVDLSAYPGLADTATLHTLHILTGSGSGEGENPLETAWVTSAPVPIEGGVAEVVLAPHSASILAVPFGNATSTSSAAPPSGFAVGPPSPNPARGTVSLAVTLAEPAAVGAVVYDALGRAVLEVPERPLASGAQAFAFSTEALPSGTYVVRLTARGAQTSQSARLVTVVR